MLCCLLTSRDTVGVFVRSGTLPIEGMKRRDSDTIT
jgi:hypothetical protein